MLAVRMPSTPTSVFEVWLDLMQLVLPIAIQSSTLDVVHLTLYLNRFRREPAISEFDWSFTPNHRSSQRFATRTGSILRSAQLTFNLSMVRSLGFGFNATNMMNISSYMPFVDLFSLRLSISFGSACDNNSLTHYTKGTSSGLWTLRLLVSIRFQDLFHCPVRTSVSPFPHGTSSLSITSNV